MKELIEKLNGVEEYYLAGFMSGKTVYERYAYALINLYAHVELPKYTGGRLYPCGEAAFYRNGHALDFHYSFPLVFTPEKLKEYTVLTDDERQYIVDTVKKFYICGQAISPRHELGGRGYNHYVPAFAEILKNGLQAESPIDNEFVRMLQKVYSAIGELIGRIRGVLLADGSENALRLAKAYGRVPFKPANNFFEAMVCINLIYQLDGCDSLGALDRYLEPYSDSKDEEQRLLLREFFEGVDRAHGWNCIVGGHGHYTHVTRLCIEESKGLAAPNLAFKLSKDLPDTMFEVALKRVASGGGMPAFYNEELYISGLEKMGMPAEDAREFVLGGCTETMFAGKADCGSIDAGINLPQVMYGTILRSRADSFERLLEEYLDDLRKEVDVIAEEVRRDRAKKREGVPQFVRSLLSATCAESGRDFHNGGVPYRFSVINVCGLANATDALSAIREVCFAEKKFTLPQIANFLQNDFLGGEDYFHASQSAPKFGNDLDESDNIAKELADVLFSAIRAQSGAGLHFRPACIMFSCYTEIGARTEASADLRRCGAPLADSGGAHQGRDVNGVTSLLNSCLKLPQTLALGTWVVNIRLSGGCFRSENGLNAVKALIRTYFAAGGMQLQINCVDQEILEKAYKNPEEYGSLVIRLGGYSDYFVRLDRALQRSLLDRIEHNI